MGKANYATDEERLEAKRESSRRYAEKNKDKIKQAYHDNPEKYLERQKQWREENKDKVNRIKTAYYQKNKEAIKAKEKRQAAENYTEYRERKNLAQRNKYRNRRIRMLNHLGGKCTQCGIDDWRVLQIDHINNDGYLDRGIHGYQVDKLYSDVLEQGTDKYQVLCANCHMIKSCGYDDNEKGEVL